MPIFWAHGSIQCFHTQKGSLHWWLLPMPQHLIQCPLPIYNHCVGELADFLSSWRAPTPSTRLTRLVLCIIIYKSTTQHQSCFKPEQLIIRRRRYVLVVNLSQHQPAQIPTPVTLWIRIYPPLRLVHTMAAEWVVLRQTSELSQKAIRGDVVLPCRCHRLTNVWRIECRERALDMPQRSECVYAVLS